MKFMRHIKLFEKFQNISEMYYGGKYEFLGSFGIDEFEQFINTVEDWEMKTGKKTKRIKEINLYESLLHRKKSLVLVETDSDLVLAVIGKDNKISVNVNSSFAHEMIFNQEYKLLSDDYVAKRVKDTIYSNI